MTDNTANNKRIAKNTIALYFRMILVIVVSLYTNRVILDVLGVEDFGIYNIVAGVVVLFSFLNSAMTNACQRYLSVAIGKNDAEFAQKVFSASLLSHIVLIGIVLLLGETIGLWFVDTQLDIPDTRHSASVVIYHIALITTCVSIIRVPFNAAIVAHERMSFYAYSSIFETLLKLVIVWLIQVFDGDNLIIYSVLLLIVTIVVNVVYLIFCQIKFKQKLSLKTKLGLLKEMTAFSGWNVFGGVADVGYKQGTNIILNIFCGVSLNAAMGITNQVRAAIYNFVSNLQTAANPQIIKTYSQGDYAHFRTLVFSISKYSYFLMLLMVIPLILNMDYILRLWLKNPPDHSTSFSQLILIFCLIDSLTGPLWTAMQATGKIKQYMIVTSICLLLNLPLTYLFLWMGYAPESLLIIQIFVNVITFFVRLCFQKVCLKINIWDYLKSVVLPILLVSILAVPIPMAVGGFFEAFSKLILTTTSSVVLVVAFVYFVGLSKSEKLFVKTFIRNRIRR